MPDNPILKSLADPEALESLHRSRPSEFSRWLEAATGEHPGSETLRVWNARLMYDKAPDRERPRMTAMRVFLIAIVAGLLVKLPALAGVDGDWYTSRFTALIVVGSLIAYFLASGASDRRLLGIGGLLSCAAIAALLPEKEDSSSVTMSLAHLPLVMVSVLAATFMGTSWREAKSRLSFVRFLGEMGVYASIVLLGGIVLTLLTIALFSLIDIDVFGWYVEWVATFGLVAAPVVGTYLYDVMASRESRLAIIIANVFAPLFLVTVCGYLAMIAFEGKSPYSDRDFLITINGLLLVVLGITIYSISGRSRDQAWRAADLVNVGLVSVTLIINALALSAIVYRWAEFGMTPNRVAVTGSNILIFCHLAYILKEYWGALRGRQSPERLLRAVAGYLPAYSCWSVLMAIGLPLAFWFE